MGATNTACGTGGAGCSDCTTGDGGVCTATKQCGPAPCVGCMDVTVTSGLEFSSYATQDVTVSMPNAGPFSKVEWNFQAQGGTLAQCTDRYNCCCSSTGDYVDRVISNGLVLPGADGGTEIEFDRAITNYGGLTSYSRDITALAPLLGANPTFRIAVQNGCTNGGYQVQASLHLEPGTPPAPSFSQAVQGISFVRILDDADAGFGSDSVQVSLSSPINSAQLYVFATGHNSQGLSCEEFCPGNPINFAVDGADAGTLTPQMGANDPSCVAGCDGCGHCGASSVNREGWCPGKPSRPYLLPIGSLPAGPHQISFTSPGAVTAGGYWLVSASIVAP
jgi:hypothetical protein